MTEKRSSANSRRVKVMGLAGVAAFVTLGALSLGFGHGAGTTGINLAGSGDAPGNTTYTQPAPGAMKMGATATFTTPSSVLATEKFVPAPLSAG